MWFGIPRKVEHIDNAHYFKNEKPWYFKGANQTHKATLSLRDEVISLKYDVPRADIEKYKFTSKITTPGGRYSRAMLLETFSWEEPFTSLFKRDPSSMKGRPQLLIIQNDTRAIKDSIKNVTGYLPGIGDWFGTNFLDFDHGEKKFKNDKNLYHEIQLGTFAKITLWSGLQVTEIIENFTAEQESYAVIDYKDPTSYDNALRLFGHLENFFNFIFSAPHSTHIFTSSYKSRKKNIKLSIVSPKSFKNLYRAEQHGGSMLFKFDDVSDVNQLFISWLLEYDKFHEIAEAIVLLKSTRVSEEMRFTTIINALEAVHRRYYDAKPQSDSDYLTRVQSILTGVPENEKIFVESKLKFGNSMSLRNRLKDIVGMAQTFGLAKFSRPDLNKIITTRNYYTHGDPALKTTSLTNNELYTVNALLGKYLKFLLLRIIKMPDDELKKIIASSNQLAGYYRDEPADPTLYL